MELNFSIEEWSGTATAARFRSLMCRVSYGFALANGRIINAEPFYNFCLYGDTSDTPWMSHLVDKVKEEIE